ncbi:MAG: hypothetical protein L0Z62_36875 [Gemmataceae bacterium]|nr:hypothetical protein [Gemmataceae bacterium]
MSRLPSAALCLLTLVFVLGPVAVAQDIKPVIIEDRLTRDDPLDRLRRQSHHKIHEVTLAKNISYLIDLDSTDFDTYLRLENAGKVLAENDDINPQDLNSRLGFMTLEGGKFRLVVTSYKGGEVGMYRLRVRALERVGDPQALAGKLTKDSPTNQGKPYHVQILKLAAAKLYWVEVEGKGFPPTVLLLDGRGKPVQVDANPSGNKRARLVFTPPVAGAYRVAVLGNKAGATGSYWMTVQAHRPLRAEEPSAVVPEK